MSVIKENDVCILIVDGFPSCYVKVEVIVPDIKPDWFEVGLIELSFPPAPIIWKLQENHLNGDIIHMQGKELQLQHLDKIIVKKEPIENLKLADIIDLSEWKKAKMNSNSSLEIKLIE